MKKAAFKVFEENFTNVCRREGVSIRKVFKECGIPRTRYYFWKDGENGLDKMDVRKIADYLHTTYRYLITDHSMKPLTDTRNVLYEVKKAFGDDARWLLINYLQLTDEGKRALLQNAILRANSLYGVSGGKRYEDTTTSN